MEERRRSLRTELRAELFMKRLDQQGEEKVPIHVCDLSKGGMGFECDRELEPEAVYECNLIIWTKEEIKVFIEIVRRGETPTGYHYGASFVGMNELDAYRIQVYQTVEQYKH